MTLCGHLPPQPQPLPSKIPRPLASLARAILTSVYVTKEAKRFCLRALCPTPQTQSSFWIPMFLVFVCFFKLASLSILISPHFLFPWESYRKWINKVRSDFNLHFLKKGSPVHNRLFLVSPLNSKAYIILQNLSYLLLPITMFLTAKLMGKLKLVYLRVQSAEPQDPQTVDLWQREIWRKQNS